MQTRNVDAPPGYGGGYGGDREARQERRNMGPLTRYSESGRTEPWCLEHMFTWQCCEENQMWSSVTCSGRGNVSPGAGDPGALPPHLIFVSFSFLFYAVSSKVGSKDKSVRETGPPASSGCSQAWGGPGQEAAEPCSITRFPGFLPMIPSQPLVGRWRCVLLTSPKPVRGTLLLTRGRGRVWASLRRHLALISSFYGAVGWASGKDSRAAVHVAPLAGGGRRSGFCLMAKCCRKSEGKGVGVPGPRGQWWDGGPKREARLLQDLGRHLRQGQPVCEAGALERRTEGQCAGPAGRRRHLSGQRRAR